MRKAKSMTRQTAVLMACMIVTGSALATPLEGSQPPTTNPTASAPVATRTGYDGKADKSPTGGEQNDHHFVADNASIVVLLNALSGRLHRAVVASEKVRHKRVTGEFDLTQPRALLTRLSESMSLLWYDDGSSIYLYDNSEIKNAVVSMQHATVRNLREFLRETRLTDTRFPVRGDGLSSTFYVTGAPVYVNLVTAAARYLDEVRGSAQSGKQVVKVVPLHNSFVVDRKYALRDQQVDIPGMATVLGKIFGRTRRDASTAPPVVAAAQTATQPVAKGDEPNAAPFSLSDALPMPASSVAATTSSTSDSENPNGGIALPASDGVRAIAYPDTNSVILAGPLDKVQDMEALIHSLDVEKRQIELSLWIVDIKKSRLDQLGIDWRGALSGQGIGASFNGGSGNATTLDGAQFLASVKALSQDGDATVVSRPILLTQENVPATFDSNQTFYAKLVGERTAQLDHVTYGTLVNVLPRLTNRGSQVEMMVNIEDGNTDGATNDGQIVGNNTMPLVDRTEINTVARVPGQKSLLIGGNTRDDVRRRSFHIPGLASIPLIGGLFRGHSDRHEQVVRVFLIQPKLLQSRATWQDGQSWESGQPAENQTLRATVELLKPYMDDRQ
ncbi:type III secretion system outer membrane ring subunit SctC [Burkholderia ubonensis]|uniref:type III secretion system outer membrane ring subunit SctC n=1 Tax=Burkholderia ubonensis TaxID=101571 RepID=UPI0008FDCA10|nr:EscC/YscC/HrcC family type III secretion system outer membrane ring protein [Burkholderia ubonensis]